LLVLRWGSHTMTPEEPKRAISVGHRFDPWPQIHVWMSRPSVLELDESFNFTARGKVQDLTYPSLQ